MLQAVTRRWDELLGARIDRVEGGERGETTISLSLGGAAWTVTVARTRALRSSLTATPSGAVERVTPVFTDDAAMLTLETHGGELLTVAGGRAWMG
jgi:hypothetical protein